MLTKLYCKAQNSKKYPTAEWVGRTHELNPSRKSQMYVVEWWTIKNIMGEAVSTACFLINKCPSTAINMKTPMEKWSNKPADYNGLKVFGCLAYAHIKQDKLQPRALRCIFIGYPERVQGYKM